MVQLIQGNYINIYYRNLIRTIKIMNKLLIPRFVLLSYGNETQIKQDLDKLCLQSITIHTDLKD